MQYMGSKNRISKEILPIILSDKKLNQTFYDVFCGGCNLIDKIQGKRIANDKHFELIEMWKSLQNGWEPPEHVSKELYYNIKDNPKNYSPDLVGFVGFLCSFGGKWWGGYAANSKNDNYAARGKRQLLKQVLLLKDVVFTNLNYADITFEPNSLIYLDPPYAGTTEYRNKFNHDDFWNWVRNISINNDVYISEYHAPNDFICLKEIITKTILDKNSQYPRIEKLFKLRK